MEYKLPEEKLIMDSNKKVEEMYKTNKSEFTFKDKIKKSIEIRTRFLEEKGIKPELRFINQHNHCCPICGNPFKTEKKYKKIVYSNVALIEVCYFPNKEDKKVGILYALCKTCGLEMAELSLSINKQLVITQYFDKAEKYILERLSDL